MNTNESKNGTKAVAIRAIRSVEMLPQNQAAKVTAEGDVAVRP
jgi:hypothetical protein